MFRFILQQQQRTRTSCSSSSSSAATIVRRLSATCTSSIALATNSNLYLQATAIPRLVDLGRLSSSSSTASTTLTGETVDDRLGKLFDLVGGLNEKLDGINDSLSRFENETKKSVDSMNDSFSRLESETKQRLDSVNENLSRLENETKKGLESMNKNFSRLENETKKDLASVKQNMTNLERKYEALESTTNAALEQERRERREHERQRDVRFKELSDASDRHRDAFFRHLDQSFKDLKTEVVDETKMYYEKSVIATSDSFRNTAIEYWYVAVIFAFCGFIFFWYLSLPSLHRNEAEHVPSLQKAELERQNTPALESVKKTEGALQATSNAIHELPSSDLVSERVGENNKSSSESHCQTPIVSCG